MRNRHFKGGNDTGETKWFFTLDLSCTHSGLSKGGTWEFWAIFCWYSSFSDAVMTWPACAASLAASASASSLSFFA